MNHQNCKICEDKILLGRPFTCSGADAPWTLLDKFKISSTISYHITYKLKVNWDASVYFSNTCPTVKHWADMQLK